MSEEESTDRKLGRISPDTCALLICDIQEKFRPAIYKFDHIVSNTKKLVEACNILKIPTFATEQYPKGLGNTVLELKIQDYGITPVAKTCFTMALPQIVDELKNKHSKVNNIILCGVESHVCVLATCQDYLELGYNVHVVVDCSSSRNNVDRMFAFQRMKQMGCWLTTSESVILSLVGDSRVPQFKSLQKLIHDKSLDAGLDPNDGPPILKSSL